MPYFIAGVTFQLFEYFGRRYAVMLFIEPDD